MGADLFDSNVASMAAALVIASTLGGNNVEMVFVFAALGLLASIIGVMTARIGKHGSRPGRSTPARMSPRPSTLY
jgi:K(+)-stimulated pyrophosphate-energized sodium pump